MVHTRTPFSVGRVSEAATDRMADGWDWWVALR